MKITEMKNCIEKMRECYKFDDDKTEIRLGSPVDNFRDRSVSIYATDGNGTRIEMSRYADELDEK